MRKPTKTSIVAASVALSALTVPLSGCAAIILPPEQPDLCDAQQVPLDSPTQKRCQQLRDITNKALHTIDPQGNYENIQVNLVQQHNGQACAWANDMEQTITGAQACLDNKNLFDPRNANDLLTMVLAHEAAHIVLKHSTQLASLKVQQYFEIKDLKSTCASQHVARDVCDKNLQQLKQQQQRDLQNAHHRQESAANIVGMYAMACQRLDPVDTWAHANANGWIEISQVIHQIPRNDIMLFPWPFKVNAVNSIDWMMMSVDTQPRDAEGHASAAEETRDILPHVKAMQAVAGGEMLCPLPKLLPEMVKTDFKIAPSTLPFSNSGIPHIIIPSSGTVRGINPQTGNTPLKSSLMSPHAL